MKKESKVQKILMLILSLVLLSTSVLSITISKYVTEQNADFQGDQHLDYTVNSVFVVKNQEELFAAINQGYTYVQLDQDIENPLIITQKAETLNSDLILDLNGIEIQRNGYEPILNIKPGVRLTVVDTSAEQTGGLYNPVGSVFNITGGTLTIVTGTFESGPRYSEYYSYNSRVLNNSNGSVTKRTLVEDAPKKVLMYNKVDHGNGSYSFTEPVIVDAPIIKSYPEKIGNVEYNHGNLYFDTGITKGDLTINPDTYCYYRTSEDRAAEVNNEAAADWYYSYYVDPNNGYDWFATTVPAEKEDDYVKITIYGYEQTIEQASKIESQQDYYAAIQMQSGTLDVQNGGFYSYFGVDKTACVNSQGGNISIKKGKFSSRIPNATGFTQNGVSEKELDELAFDDNYFNNYIWSSQGAGEQYKGNLARQGESYCILNGGDATVTIDTGELYSSNNGIISMHGGELSILGGNFTKRITNGRVTDVNSEMSAIYMEQGSLTLENASCNVVRNDSDTGIDLHSIYMLDGQFNSTNTTYRMDGAKSIGIKMLDGMLNVVNGDCVIIGNDAYGIHSSIDSETDLVITNSSFDITGDNSTGIYSTKGRVNISTDGAKSISVSGSKGTGIHVLDGGSVNSINYSYLLNGDNSIGIWANDTATGINVENGDMSIVGANTYGIKSSIKGVDNFTVKDLSILMTGGGAAQTGIYSENGKVQVTATSAKTISTSGVSGKGIYVLSGGSVESINYSYSLIGDNSIGILADSDATGIMVDNGNMAISGSYTYGIQSYISSNENEDKFTVENLSITMTGGNNQTGIYSENGKVKVSATSEKIISTSGVSGKGIHVLNNGLVESTNYSYSLTGNDSIGIFAEADATSIDVSDGKMTITGDKSFGIKSSIPGTTSFNVSNLPITMTNGTQQTGIYSENGQVNISADSSTTISINDANGKGVHVSTGGSVVSVNYSYHLKGATSHGIYSTAGLVDISGGNITLDSNQSSYGVYAFSNEQINVNVAGATIDVGYANNTGDKNGNNIRASVGVFLASNNANSKITLTNTNIRCYEVGVLVDGGSLDIKSTSADANDISTRKASSIVVKDGNITFDESCNYNITSSTTRNNNKDNVFTITLPTINENTNESYDNYDGVYVDGGNFISNGNVNITHKGLLNDVDSWRGYADIVIRSFAVRVKGGMVTLNKATITNSVGGGVSCDGGNVTLGTADSVRSDITIRTTGNTVQNNTWESVNNDRARNDSSWDRRKTTTGGHAMEINNGNLVVYEGTYTAAHGDGIKLNAPRYVSGDRTTVTIHNGSFDGQMQNDLDGKRSGPAGCYGVKVYGPAVINIYDGVFNGRAGGACVGGAYAYNFDTNRISYDLNYKAEVYIYKAKFGTTSVPNDGFMIYDNSKIIFGAGGADIASKDAITVNANLAAFSINFLTFQTYTGHDQKSCDVYVYYGTYGGSYQGWNKSGAASQVIVYNRLPGLTERNTTSGTGGEAIADRENRNIIYYPQTV